MARIRLGLALAALCTLTAGTGVSAAIAPAAQEDGPARSLWIVVLDAPPVVPVVAEAAAKRGQPAGASIRPDLHGAEASAWRQQIAARRAALLATAGSVLQRPLAPRHVYEYALHGMAVRLSAAEAESLRALPGVRSVTADVRRRLQTDAGPAWIHADDVWQAPAPLGNRGEGVVIGVIDSGIYRAHPAFAEVGPKDGHRHANPLGRRFGRCASTPSECNDKLIGIWDFTDEAARDGSDVDGHGTHVAATAAGNALDHSFQLPSGSVPRPVSGVAPHANLISYKACIADDPATEDEDEGGCSLSALLRAIDQAVADGVDIINYSIGGTDSNPWSCLAGGCNQDEEAMLNAFAAGVLPVVAAGNEGPGRTTVTTPGNAPWVLTVANASHDRLVANRLLDLSGGAGAPPLDGVLIGSGFTAGTGNLPIVIPADDPDCGLGDGIGLDANGNPDGSTNPWAANPAPRFNGEIVACLRGTHARIAKSDNVRREGAGGFILLNTAADGESVNGDAHSLPGVHLGHAAALALQAWLQAGSGHRGRIEGSSVQVLPERADVLSASSGRGPGRFGRYLLPDVTAPGTDIIAADRTGTGTTSKSGTSMASPHVAGAAALLRSAHPQWTPSDLVSALVTTARPSARLEDGSTPAGVDQQGAGVVDALRALHAGLSLRVSASDYRTANPLQGGDPATLNEAALLHPSCFQTCSFTRRVTDLAGGGTWDAVAELPDGATLAVNPSRFTLAAGATQALAITLDVRDPRLPGGWVDGRLRLKRSGGDGVSDAVLPLSVYAAPGAVPADVVIDTARGAGFHDLPLAGLVAMPDLSFAATRLADVGVQEKRVVTDPTTADPYDSNTGTMSVAIEVPAGAGVPYRLVVDASGGSVELFVGIDRDGEGKASAWEELCRGAASAGGRQCVLDLTGTSAVQRYWVLAQQTGVAADVRVETALVDMRVDPNSALTATGPGATGAGEAFATRIAFDDPTLLPGAARRGYVWLGATEARRGNTAAVPVLLRRSGGESAARALLPGETHALWLAAGAAQERLYIEVPPNATRLELDATGVGLVDLYAAHAASPSSPTIDAAPPRGQAQASSRAAGATERIVLEGAALLPGRWYVTPVNTGAGTARVDLTAKLSYAEGAVVPRFGAWFNPARSGAGVFLYEVGEAWAMLWYTYLQDGTPTWYIGAAPAPTAGSGGWTVPLQRAAWNGTAQKETTVGEAVFAFTEAGRMQMAWNLDGESGSEPLEWIDGGACPAGGEGITGSWYAPSLPGYGWSINAYAALESNAAYFYDAQGRARWAFGVAVPFGSDEIVLEQYSGACPLCSYRAPTTVPVGSFVRSYGADGSGTAALDVSLLPPLSGQWNTSAPVARLTDPIACPTGR